jgi:hypothetical protein
MLLINDGFFNYNWVGVIFFENTSAQNILLQKTFPNPQALKINQIQNLSLITVTLLD